MTDSIETPPEGGEQASPETPSNVTEIYADNMVYDTGVIADFFSMVFHTDAEEGEHILAQASKSAPRGFGKEFKQLLPMLARTKQCMPCYFGSSTLAMGEYDGKALLRNKKTAFKRFYVVLLDDVGTKIPWDKIPEGLDPTYKIESSPDNYQLGFVLESPIDTYEVAALLCHYVKQSGLTDKGGIMPCKKIRMPCGVNGKKGDNRNFPVRLHDMEGPYWSPQSLLTAMGVEVNWEKVVETGMTMAEKTRTFGATAWSPIQIEHFNGEGVYDPVTEWMDEQGMIAEDVNGDGWIAIKCPWHAGHTNKEERLAGYSPIGHGSSPSYRSFNCFHDHCESQDTDTFLTEVADLGGPRVPSREMFPELAADNVYDIVNDKVCNIRKQYPVSLPLANVKKITNSVKMVIGDKVKQVNPYDIWLKLASCVKVQGDAYDPTQDAKIVERQGNLFVNTFGMPHYNHITADEEKYGPFKRYIAYLIPDAEERDYFLDWLACKVQNREYRGPAIVMIGLVEGAGRNTLMIMLQQLFGESNVVPAALHEIENPNFNEYMASLICYVDETIASQDQAKRSRFYEAVKTNVDPLAQQAIVNRKYGTKLAVTTVTSFLFFSNHEDAIHVAGGTRRIFALSNTKEVGKAEFFSATHKWMRAEGWAQHVWQWLLDRPADMAFMSSAPPQTKTFTDMTEASKSDLDHILDAVCELFRDDLNCPYIPLTPVINFIYNEYTDEIGHISKQGIRREFRKQVITLGRSGMPESMRGDDGSIHKVKALTREASTDDAVRRAALEPFRQAMKVIDDSGEFRARMSAKLNERDTSAG
jgi:hypothetical protein